MLRTAALRTAARTISQEIKQPSSKNVAFNTVPQLKGLLEKLAHVVKNRSSEIQQELIAVEDEYGSSVYAWSAEQAQKSRHYEQSIYNQAAREAAHAHTIGQALTSTNDVLKKYNLFADHDELLTCIDAKHKIFLLNSFNTSFMDLDLSEKIALGAALEPGVLEIMCIKTDASLQAAIHNHQASLPPEVYLNQSELMGLIDYVNSKSGVFNAVNGAARAEVYYGESSFQQIVAPLSNQVVSALEKLSKNPAFAKENSLIFKGVNLSRPDGCFMRLFLDHSLANKSPLLFPHVISGTSDQSMSYAENKQEDGYHDELAMKLPGIDVSLFHDTDTKHEKEVIGMPGQKFWVAEKTIREFSNRGRAAGITVYHLEPYSEK